MKSNGKFKNLLTNAHEQLRVVCNSTEEKTTGKKLKKF